jgi:hypothetical protein
MERAVQRVDLAGSHLSVRRPAPISGYIATYRACHANTRIALLELYVQLRRSCVRRYLEWHGVLLVLSIPCRGSPLCVKPLVVLMPRAYHVGVTTINVHLQMV